MFDYFRWDDGVLEAYILCIKEEGVEVHVGDVGGEVLGIGY